MALRPWRYKPCVPLGKGATVEEEVFNYIHHLGNQLMVLAARMEIRKAERRKRRKAYHADRRRLRLRRKK